jgi:hypothetical protein
VKTCKQADEEPEPSNKTLSGRGEEQKGLKTTLESVRDERKWKGQANVVIIPHHKRRDEATFLIFSSSVFELLLASPPAFLGRLIFNQIEKLSRAPPCVGGRRSEREKISFGISSRAQKNP